MLFPLVLALLLVNLTSEKHTHVLLIIDMKHYFKNLVSIILSWDYTLFTLVFILVFVIPIFPIGIRATLYSSVFTLTYLFAALAVGREKKFYIWFALIVMILEWVSELFGFFAISELSKSLSVLFFMLIVVNFIIQIAKSREVNIRLILEAINGYLLLAIVFAMLVAIIMKSDPQAFNFVLVGEGGEALAIGFEDYMYYSLVTITTLGYGDIAPQIPVAKSLAALMAVCGQFYVAILVAMIVGKFAAKMGKE